MKVHDAMNNKKIPLEVFFSQKFIKYIVWSDYTANFRKNPQKLHFKNS